ncbi:hypothetical protein CK203_049771 [Vitis vinifera]|uniref:Uncharacterized protein n=1 Tax=Vitis vinifera TaxID=29760 RepID=A0A438H2R3_VITVI|nr:hypothetical protein CK203_049771 [Vitis vinifera]
MTKLEPLEADHSKLKANFAGLRNQPLAGNDFAAICLLRNFAAIFQPNSEDFSSKDERLGFSSLGVRKAGGSHELHELCAEVSRGWDEPNARDMGRMTSQPNVKGEMYILNDGIDMKVKYCSYGKEIGRARSEEDARSASHLSDTIASMPCAICLSYEHLVDECPTIPAVREMFGDCNTYNSNWKGPSKFLLGTTATSVQVTCSSTTASLKP